MYNHNIAQLALSNLFILVQYGRLSSYLCAAGATGRQC